MSTLGPDESFGHEEGEAKPALYDYEKEHAVSEQLHYLGKRKSLARRVTDSCYGIKKEEALWLGISAVSAVAVVGLLEGQDDIRSFVEHSLGFARDVLNPYKNWNLPR